LFSDWLQAPLRCQSSNCQIAPTDRLHDVVIVGSGAAGYTAALYTARAQLDTVLIEGTSSGGALMSTTVVDNYPGVPEGTTGPDLIHQMRSQAARFGARMSGDDADTVALDEDVKIVAAGEKTWHARAVILAMGSAPRRLTIAGGAELWGRGVRATAKGAELGLRGQEVAVIGGGGAAMEEALFLAGIAGKVTIVHHRNDFRASAITTSRVRAHDKITVLTDTEATAVLGGRHVAGLRVQHVVTGRERELPVSAVVVAIGHAPRSELVTGLVDLDPSGYVLTRDDTTHTSLAGVFAAGDLVDRRYRQAVTAAASGCAAALDAERWLAQPD
jgi:thioredoxin reductase (NADPH)